MADRQQQSHVPKFGNWETDNVPYTAYFENARREKGGLMMNPNDPEENPQAFNMCMRGGGHNIDDDDDDPVTASSGGTFSHHNTGSLVRRSHEGGHHVRHHLQQSQRSRGSHGSFTADPVCERSHSDYSVTQRRASSDNKKSMSEGGSSVGSFSSSSSHHDHRRNGSHYSNDYSVGQIHKATTVPKFGTWDEKDPKSGEGYTLIFNRVKEEKQIQSQSTHFPNDPSQLPNSSNIQNQCRSPSTSRLSKYCCCLFSKEGK